MKLSKSVNPDEAVAFGAAVRSVLRLIVRFLNIIHTGTSCDSNRCKGQDDISALACGCYTTVLELKLLENK